MSSGGCSITHPRTSIGERVRERDGGRRGPAGRTGIRSPDGGLGLAPAAPLMCRSSGRLARHFCRTKTPHRFQLDGFTFEMRVRSSFFQSAAHSSSVPSDKVQVPLAFLRQRVEEGLALALPSKVTVPMQTKQHRRGTGEGVAQQLRRPLRSRPLRARVRTRARAPWPSP